MKHLIFVVMLSSCSCRMTVTPDIKRWEGTGGVALACGDGEDRIYTCVGLGKVWACVSYKDYSGYTFVCAPKTFIEPPPGASSPILQLPKPAEMLQPSS